MNYSGPLRVYSTEARSQTHSAGFTATTVLSPSPRRQPRSSTDRPGTHVCTRTHIGTYMFIYHNVPSSVYYARYNMYARIGRSQYFVIVSALKYDKNTAVTHITYNEF